MAPHATSQVLASPVSCLEVPCAVGAAIWSHLTIGTQVTVTG